MEQQFIHLITQKITDHYQQIKSLLLNLESYPTKVDLQNVQLYFSFLESVLEMPFNRLSSVAAFVGGDDGQLTAKMYPFALLKEETKETIHKHYINAINFANSLELTGIDPEFISLCEEEQLAKTQVI